jgi:hypothetical protein
MLCAGDPCANRGPATTEIDSPHLLGRGRLTGGEPCPICPRNRPPAPTVRNSVGTGAENLVGKWNRTGFPGSPHPVPGGRTGTRGRQPPVFRRGLVFAVDSVAYTLTGVGSLGVFRPIRGGSVSATRSGQSDGVRRTQPPTLTSARPTKLSVVRWPDPWSPAGHPRTACKRQGLACWREARRAHDRWPCQPCATPLPPGASEKAPPRPRTSRGP